MRIPFLVLALSALMPALPAWAGDADRGAREFNKCKACHTLEAPDGREIVKGGLTGPNLYGVIGRRAGTAPGFRRYSSALAAAGSAGLVWDATTLAAYVADPDAFLRARLGDSSASGTMTYRLARGAEDVAAYLDRVARGGS